MDYSNHIHPHPCSFYGCNHPHDSEGKCTGAYGLFGPAPKPPRATFELGDDGTLDTVVVCTSCHLPLSYDSTDIIDVLLDTGDFGDDPDVLNMQRIETAKIWARDDHACPIAAEVS